MKLRPYQNDILSAVRGAFRIGKRRVLIEAATGLGKTITFVGMAEMTKAKGKRTLILCNRDNLVNQACAKFNAFTKDHARVEAGESKPMITGQEKVIVGSIQTMQGKRLQRWDKNYFDLVITDEVHGAASNQFKAVLNHFSEAHHVGFSATIERHDGQGVGWFYEEIVYRYGLMQAIDDGWLVPLEFQKVPVPVPVSEAVANKKSLSEEDEEYALNPHVEKIMEELAKMIESSKSLIFLPTCKASEAAAQMLRGHSIDCRHVDSSFMHKNQTKAELSWFRELSIGALSNSQLLSTGYDQPDIDSIAILRLIKSTPLFTQIIGRGTRPIAPVDQFPTAELRKEAIRISSKPKCRIIDILIQSDNHDFASASCLVSTLKEERQAVDKATRKIGEAVDLKLLKAKVDEFRHIKDAAEALRKVSEDAANAASRATKREVYIDDIMKGNRSPFNASDKQKGFLRYLGFKGAMTHPLSSKTASRLIGRYKTMKSK